MLGLRRMAASFAAVVFGGVTFIASACDDCHHHHHHASCGHHSKCAEHSTCPAAYVESGRACEYRDISMYPEPGVPDFRYEWDHDNYSIWTPPVRTYEYMSREDLADQDRYDAGNITVRNWSLSGERQADFAYGIYPSTGEAVANANNDAQNVSYGSSTSFDRAATIETRNFDYSGVRSPALTPSELNQPITFPSGNLPRPVDTEAELRRRDMIENSYVNMGATRGSVQGQAVTGTLPEVGIDRGPTPEGGYMEEPINTTSENVDMTPQVGSRASGGSAQTNAVTTTTTTTTTATTPTGIPTTRTETQPVNTSAVDVSGGVSGGNAGAGTTTSNVGNRSNVGANGATGTTGTSGAAGYRGGAGGGGRNPDVGGF